VRGIPLLGVSVSSLGEEQMEGELQLSLSLLERVPKMRYREGISKRGESGGRAYGYWPVPGKPGEIAASGGLMVAGVRNHQSPWEDTPSFSLDLPLS